MSEPSVTIERVLEPTDEHVAALAALVPQLSSAPPPDLATLRMLTKPEGTALLIARTPSESIVGMLTLITFRLPTGVRAWIEDVVVDTDQRRSGAATALVDHALKLAVAAGSTTVDLTSRPARGDANRLYERLGFARRDTNVWRYEL